MRRNKIHSADTRAKGPGGTFIHTLKVLNTLYSVLRVGLMDHNIFKSDEERSVLACSSMSVIAHYRRFLESYSIWHYCTLGPVFSGTQQCSARSV